MVKLTPMIKQAYRPPANQETAMDVIAAADAKTNFEALLDNVQQEPIKIVRNNRDVAIVMSMEAFAEYHEAKLQLLQQDIQKGVEAVQRGEVISAADAFRISGRELGD